MYLILSFRYFSSTKSENGRAEQVLPLGGSQGHVRCGTVRWVEMLAPVGGERWQIRR
jgi:hypothetical protein